MAKRLWNCNGFILLNNNISFFWKYGLSSQITRAAVSIPSNIAEDSSRKSDKDYRRFIEIALGSSFELETQIMIAYAAGFCEQAVSLKLLSKVSDEQKMLSSFMNSLT